MSERRILGLRPWTAVAIGLLVLLAAAPVVASFVWFRGEELGRMPVGDEISTMTVTLDEPGVIELWVEIVVEVPLPFHDETDHLDHLHPSLALSIDTRDRDGAMQQRHCDVFDVRFFDHMGTTAGTSRARTLSYVGRLFRCSVRAAAGPVEISAQRAWIDREWAQFHEVELIARTRAPDPGLPGVQWHDPE